MYHRRGRQRRDEPPPIPPRTKPRVEHGEQSSVVPVTNETPESLLQRQDRERNLILAERIATTVTDGVDPGGGDRIGRRGEWQLVDDHAAQRFADHVHALPEAGGCKQDRMWRLAKPLQQLGPGRGALREDRIIERHLGDPQHVAHRRVAREEHECAASRPLQDFHDLASRRHREIQRARIRHARRQVHKGLAREIELRRKADFRRVPDPQPLPDVLERAVDGECRGRQDRGAHAIQQQLAHDGRNINGRRPEKNPAPTELHEVHVVGVARAQEEPDFLTQLARAANQRRNRLAARVVVVLVRLKPDPTGDSRGRDSRGVRLQADRSRSGKRAFEGIECARQFSGGVARLGQGRRTGAHALLAADAVRASVRESQLRVEGPGAIAQTLDRFHQVVLHSLVGRHAGGRQAFDVTRQLLDPVVADAVAEILCRDLFQLMRFVDDRVRAGRNDLAVRALPDGGIGAQQMVIDDDDIGRCRALAHARHEAIVVAGTLGAQTRLDGGGHVVPHGHVFGQIGELRAIASLRPRRPLADDRQKHTNRRVR